MVADKAGLNTITENPFDVEKVGLFMAAERTGCKSVLEMRTLVLEALQVLFSAEYGRTESYLSIWSRLLELHRSLRIGHVTQLSALLSFTD